MAMNRLEILMRKVESMQQALGVAPSLTSKPPPKRGQLTEFEETLLFARNKLKEIEDKLDERQHHIVPIYGEKSRERIVCDTILRDLVTECETTVRRLEVWVTKQRKKTMNNKENDEEMAQKEKLVELLKERLITDKREFEAPAVEPAEIGKVKGDPVNGSLSVNVGILIGRGGGNDITTEEQDALDRFQKRDKEIDDMLVLIVEDIDLLKAKAGNIDDVYFFVVYSKKHKK